MSALRPISSAPVDEFQSYADRLNRGDPWKRRLHNPYHRSERVDEREIGQESGVEQQGRGDPGVVVDEDDRGWVDLADRREDLVEDEVVQRELVKPCCLYCY